MPLPRPERKPATGSTPLALWMAIGLLVICCVWQAWLNDGLRRSVESLRVGIRGLPQVIERNEMDCGCVGGCKCCQCRKAE